MVERSSRVHRPHPTGPAPAARPSGAGACATAGRRRWPPHLEIDGFPYTGNLSPYWITIEDGRVVLIEEQFLP